MQLKQVSRHGNKPTALMSGMSYKMLCIRGPILSHLRLAKLAIDWTIKDMAELLDHEATSLKCTQVQCVGAAPRHQR